MTSRSTEEAASAAAETTVDDVVEARLPDSAAELAAHFDKRLTLHWTQRPSSEDNWVVVGVASSGARSTELRQLANELTDQLVANGIAAVPLLFTAEQWAAVGEPAERLSLLDNDSRRRLLARRELREKRQLLLRAVRADSSLIDLVARRSPLPIHVGLRLATAAIKDALGWLFASHDSDVDVGGLESAVSSFARYDGAFGNNAVLIYWQLEGLALQSYQLFLRSPPRDELSMWTRARPVLAAAARFLRQLERDIRGRFTSPEERRLRKRRRLLGGAALAAALLVVALGAHLVGQRPIEPVADDALGKEGKPGGMAAEYFADTSLLKRVVRRTDAQIWIETSKGPAPGIHFDHFSVRWRGYLFFPEAGTQTLCLRADEGARLTLKDRRLFDTWWHKRATRRCVAVQVKRGWYPLLIEYFDTIGKSVLQLERGDNKIPPEHLCCRE